MLYGFKRFILNIRVGFWKWVVLSSQARKDLLQKKLYKLRDKEEQEVGMYINSIQKDIEERELYKQRVLKEYWLWKAHILRKMKQDIGFCEKCGRHENLTVDHIIPQVILKAMGILPHTERDTRNLRLLCKICNLNKGSTLDFSDPRTKPLLLEYTKNVEGSEQFKPPVFKSAHIPTQIEKWEEKKKIADLRKRMGSMAIGKTDEELSPSQT